MSAAEYNDARVEADMAARRLPPVYMPLKAKASLEERVAQLATAQRRQRDRWADNGWCEDCGSEEDVVGAADLVTGVYRLSCHACRAKRAGVET